MHLLKNNINELSLGRVPRRKIGDRAEACPERSRGGVSPCSYFAVGFSLQSLMRLSTANLAQNLKLVNYLLNLW